ncbi:MULTISPECIES: YicC/YloC family endoribonuclease [Rhodomicrobium]|uniref:YicC/YloC family endoribonuclease n=1 Tax=Rhodomicrobium TaxID=1068 RepID=UPI000B4C07B0|nr:MULTISPECIES: YicC/YloC family endoribonuclease [Rhodomicrobium]
MPLKSMTGFGRAGGQDGEAAWSWEVRSVNNRGLDIRLRLPPGFEEFELRVRDAIAKRLTRGSLAVNLALKAPAIGSDLRLNEAALAKLAELAERARVLTGRAEPVPLEALLAMKGVIETSEAQTADESASPLIEALLKTFQAALDSVAAARLAEGARLRDILAEKVDEVEMLTRQAETAPERSPEAIAERIRVQLQRLLNESNALDENRLYQEAALIATKADIEEEIKRLHAHVAAARELIDSDAPVGRKLEFLAQEFQREANTLCSKSNAAEITKVGLRLKSAIDQFREQVQNVE